MNSCGEAMRLAVMDSRGEAMRLAAFPLLSKTQLLDPLTVNYLTFAAMFLLMISFFIIFSAWKHRFILLKY